MRWNLVLTTAILLVATQAPGSEWRLGLQGGTSNTGLSGDTPSDVSMGKKTGPAVGITGEIRLSEDTWLSIQPMQIQRGATTTLAVSGVPDGVKGPSFTMNYLAIPILARIVSNNKWTYVMGGLSPAFLLDAHRDEGGTKQDITSDFKSFDLSAIIGFGLIVPVGRPSLTFEIRYEHSILNLPASGHEDDEYVLPPRFRSSGFLFMAGLLLPLGGK